MSGYTKAALLRVCGYTDEAHPHAAVPCGAVGGGGGMDQQRME